jgi:hypothetical protein
MPDQIAAERGLAASTIYRIWRLIAQARMSMPSVC